MNNEPVAWMHKTYFPNGLYEEDLVWSKVDESSIPLYTHPAKTLTDEEIEVLWEKHCPFDLTAGIEFARAILRKAQEK
jgi:hypothetical protein